MDACFIIQVPRNFIEWTILVNNVNDNQTSAIHFMIRVMKAENWQNLWHYLSYYKQVVIVYFRNVSTLSIEILLLFIVFGLGE